MLFKHIFNCFKRSLYSRICVVPIQTSMESAVVLKFTVIDNVCYVAGYDEWMTCDGKWIISQEMIDSSLVDWAIRKFNLPVKTFELLNP